MKRTTFTKKPAKRGGVSVAGTHPSIHNGLLLVSTGIPTLDDVLGGGIPVGSIMLIEEDINNRFSKLLLKYFLAEGVLCQHGLFVASANENPTTILEHLPKPTSSRTAKIEDTSKSDHMKIAFMYKNLPKDTTTLSSVSKFGHYYDISSIMDSSLLEGCSMEAVNLGEEYFVEEPTTDLFQNALKKLKQHIDKNECYRPPTHINADTRLNVLRMGLPNLASPLWCENNDESIKHVAKFLHSLRALARNTLLVCMVTVPTHLFNKYQVSIFRQLVDCSVELKAFVGEKNPAFKDYHGLFNIHKLPCLNSLTSFVPDSFDLAFELKRTKFVIECLHLPPDISETASRQGMDESGKVKTSSPCGGTTLRKDLDF